MDTASQENFQGTPSQDIDAYLKSSMPAIAAQESETAKLREQMAKLLQQLEEQREQMEQQKKIISLFKESRRP